MGGIIAKNLRENKDFSSCNFLVLKPWESFWKDIVLMIAITLLFAGKENINELFSC